MKKVLFVYYGYLLGNHKRGDMVRIDNMMKSLQKIGYEVHMLGFYTGGFKKRHSEKLWLLSQNIVPHLYYALPTRYGCIYLSLFFRKLITWIICLRNHIDVVQAEIACSTNTVSFLRNIPLVVDFHSDMVPELEMNSARLGLIKQARKDNIYALNRANAIISVSDRLLSNLKKYSNPSSSIYSILPCSFDENLFGGMDKMLRSHTRQKLGLDNKIVLCYLGGLSIWQCIDETLDLVQNLLKLDERYFFCFYTGDKDLAKYTSKINKLKGHILIQSLNHRNIRQYMSIIDVGIVLRTNSLVNINSSPTKTAEYLASGAMVITTQYAGDAPMIVENSGCGIVLKNERIGSSEVLEIDSYIKKYVASYDVNSNMAKKYAFQERGWMSNELKLKELYNSLIK